MDVWQEIGANVFVRRYTFFDQTIPLVVGDEACLVLDTRTTYAQARELQDDIRRITSLPWIVLDTHHHFDHTFGNALFRPAEIWGHERCAVVLRESGEAMRARVIEAMPDLAGELAEVEIVPPTRTVGARGAIDVGGRTVELHHLGRGHTDNDLVAVVSDAEVVFAGDLLENGGQPSFGDAFPLDWAETNRRMLELIAPGAAVVPGHGEVAGRAFAESQTADLQTAADEARRAFAEGLLLEAVVPRVPFPEPYARQCLERAYAQLDRSLPA
jgi:glyoxylase-like metal-dependent hydrolase (beta-lactamase superfamily II)